MKDQRQIVNSSPHVNINSAPQVEPLIVGNANSIIRFICTFGVILLGLVGYLCYCIGCQEVRIAFLEDIVVNGVYKIENGQVIESSGGDER